MLASEEKIVSHYKKLDTVGQYLETLMFLIEAKVGYLNVWYEVK